MEWSPKASLSDSRAGPFRSYARLPHSMIFTIMNGCESCVTKKEPLVFYRKNKLDIIYSFVPFKSKASLSFCLPYLPSYHLAGKNCQSDLSKTRTSIGLDFFFFFESAEPLCIQHVIGSLVVPTVMK